MKKDPVQTLRDRADEAANDVDPGAPLPPRPPLDLRALSSRQAPAHEWAIDQWMSRSGRLLLAGAGGSGKSLLAQQTATAEAIGRSFIGHIGAARKALVWNCEDEEDEIWRRQESISRFFGIDLADAADNLSLVSRVGRDNVLMAPVMRTATLGKTNVFEGLRQQVNDLAIESLYLDNVAHIFGGDENSRSQVTTFINALASLVAGRPFSVGLLAHTARSQGSEYAGSAAWENAVRMRWYFGSTLPDAKIGEDDAPAKDVRYLAKRKANYAAQDHVRMTYRNGVYAPDQEPSRIDGLLRENAERKAEEIVISGFTKLQAIGLHPTDGQTSGNYLPKLLADKGFNAGMSKAELKAAMNRLMGRGQFVHGEIGKYANRTAKEGLILRTEVAA